MKKDTVTHLLAIEKIKDQKKELLQRIYDDEDLTKLEKLELINEAELLGYKSYIQHPFEKFKPFFIKQLEDAGRRSNVIDEGWVGDYCERHRDINIPEEIITCFIENICWDNGNKPGKSESDPDFMDNMVEIFSDRGVEPQMSYSLPLGEVIDVLYDWVKDNRYIGWKFDW